MKFSIFFVAKDFSHSCYHSGAMPKTVDYDLKKKKSFSLKGDC